MTKILLLDGNSLTYRAFFALPTDMTTASGQVTNAVFGFTSMLVNLLKDHKPDGIVVAFDRPEPTFRHDMIDTYKAQREAAPDILRQQMGLVRQVLEVLNVPTVEMAGYEADDLIATMATRAAAAKIETIIVTGDRDTYQLVKDPYVKVLYNRRGVSDYVLYDEAGILDKTGVTPAKYHEYAALRGDTSDNLPGVPGVGEKTAAKLINDFGGIDGIYQNLDTLTPKLRSNLAEHEDIARLNEKAMKLVCDVPMEFDVEHTALAAFDKDKARDLFQFLEFRTLWDRMLAATGDLGEADESRELAISTETITDVAKAKTALESITKLSTAVSLAPSWESIPIRSPLSGVALAHAVGERVEAIYLSASLSQDKSFTSTLQTFLDGQGQRLHIYDAKAIMHALRPFDLQLNGFGIDVRVAAYLLDPSDTEYTLSDLLTQYCGQYLPETAIAPSGQLDFGDRDQSVETGSYAAAVVQLGSKLEQALRDNGSYQLYETIEQPLIGVLARMEFLGIRVDVEYLRELTKSLTDEVATLEKEIQEIAGEPFKVNSTQQLRVILFDKLGLTPQKKGKTGYSTDSATLERLVGEHVIIEKLIRYREVEKLRSTYGESLIAEVQADGRIHATFNQTVARTGRLSSDKPNLHNIPVRSEEGRRFRRAFIPSEGMSFLVGDYNQIELRVIAHLAQDPGLIEAFRSKSDIHTTTASRVFGVDPKDVTYEQRSRAKMVAYGLAYGMEAYGLSQRLNIPVPEAAGILDAFFDAFPNIKSYMETTVTEARKRGYTETLFGRRRPIPELNSDNFRVRQAGERQAMNAGIQGLAADIFKVALIKIDHALIDAGLKARLVLQVHDEVILDVPQDERNDVEKLTLDAMHNAAELSVPLEVNIGWASDWSEK